MEHLLRIKDSTQPLSNLTVIEHKYCRSYLLIGDDLPEHGDDLVCVLARTGQQLGECRPRGRGEPEDGLELMS